MSCPPRPAAVRLDLADALRWLPARPAGRAAAVIADPPYCSGGASAADRQKSVSTKYTQNGTDRFKGAEFPGEQLDQRSWTSFTAAWMADARRAVRPGGYLLCFCDWRQLPLAADALQWAGWLWRGVVVWDKGLGARGPHRAGFRHQCEYAVYGTHGSFDAAHLGDRPGMFPGCLQYPVLQADKHHPTGKPTSLLRQLVRCVSAPGDLVIDPFAGSGTTAVACHHEGRRFAGCELDPHWHAVAAERLAAVTSVKTAPDPPRSRPCRRPQHPHRTTTARGSRSSTTPGSR